jgi:hypothetical protein
MVDFLFGAALEGTRGSLSGGSNGKAWVVETSSWWLVLAHFVLLAASTNRRDRRWLSAWLHRSKHEHKSSYGIVALVCAGTDHRLPF